VKVVREKLSVATHPLRHKTCHFLITIGNEKPHLQKSTKEVFKRPILVDCQLCHRSSFYRETKRGLKKKGVKVIINNYMAARGIIMFISKHFDAITFFMWTQGPVYWTSSITSFNFLFFSCSTLFLTPILFFRRICISHEFHISNSPNDLVGCVIFTVNWTNRNNIGTYPRDGNRK